MASMDIKLAFHKNLRVLIVQNARKLYLLCRISTISKMISSKSVQEREKVAANSPRTGPPLTLYVPESFRTKKSHPLTKKRPCEPRITSRSSKSPIPPANQI